MGLNIWEIENLERLKIKIPRKRGFSIILIDKDVILRDFQLKVSDQKIFSWIDSINRVENLEVEFKSSLPTTPDLRRFITGMANGDSGIIFIGIADNGTPIGIDNPDQAKRQINHALRLNMTRILLA